jgi:hypothetical protein
MARDDERGALSASASDAAARTAGNFGRIGTFVPDDPARAPTWRPGEGPREPQGDVLDRLPGIESAPGSAGLRFPSAEADVLTPGTLGGRLRLVVREFLEAVPRSQARANIALLRPDGTTRVFTRDEFSMAIDAMRPRMRQIVRLAVEERWPRQRVCDYLNNISIKTFERDHAEAFDELMAFVLSASDTSRLQPRARAE